MTEARTVPLMGRLDDPDGEAERSGKRGGIANVQVRLRDGVVTDAVFLVHGCSVTMACLSAACALSRGRTPGQIRREVTEERIDEVLGGLPEDHEHCARLARATLLGAIEDALLNSREKWRKLYQVNRRSSSRW